MNHLKVVKDLTGKSDREKFEQQYLVLKKRYEETADSFAQSCLNYQLAKLLLKISGKEDELYFQLKLHVKNLLEALDEKGFRYEDFHPEKVEALALKMSVEHQRAFFNYLHRKLEMYHYGEHIEWCKEHKRRILLEIKKNKNAIGLLGYWKSKLLLMCFCSWRRAVIVCGIYLGLASVLLSKTVLHYYQGITFKTVDFSSNVFINQIANVLALHLSLDDGVKLVIYDWLGILLVGTVKLLLVICVVTYFSYWVWCAAQEVSKNG